MSLETKGVFIMSWVSNKTDIVPICGEHFCELCGDCINCYGEDACQEATDGIHYLHIEEVIL